MNDSEEMKGVNGYCQTCGKKLPPGRRGYWKYFCNKKCYERKFGKSIKYKRRTKEIKPEMKKQLMVALLGNNKKTKTDISIVVWQKKLIHEGEKKPDDELTKGEKKRATAYMSRIFAELEKDRLIIVKPAKNGHYVQFNPEEPRQIAKWFLHSDDETAFAFVSAKTTQKMFGAIITLFENKIGFGFTDDTKSAIKRILPWSPTAMKKFLFSDFDSIMQVEKRIELVKPQCINIDINIPEQIDYQKIIGESTQAAGIVKITAGNIAWTLISLFDRISRAERTILKLLYACMIIDLATNPSLAKKIEESEQIIDEIDIIPIKTSASGAIDRIRQMRELKGTYKSEEKLRQYFASKTQNIKKKGD